MEIGDQATWTGSFLACISLLWQAGTAIHAFFKNKSNLKDAKLRETLGLVDALEFNSMQYWVLEDGAPAKTVSIKIVIDFKKLSSQAVDGDYKKTCLTEIRKFRQLVTGGRFQTTGRPPYAADSSFVESILQQANRTKDAIKSDQSNQN